MEKSGEYVVREKRKKGSKQASKQAEHSKAQQSTVQYADQDSDCDGCGGNDGSRIRSASESEGFV